MAGDLPAGGSPVLRPVTPDDEPFLWQMLGEAASWARPEGEEPCALEDLLVVPQIAHYVAGWGRAGDGGVIAGVDGQPAGACWSRTFTAEHPGYGFLGERIPGLGFAVRPERRRRGIGTSLLAGAIAMAWEQGHSAVGLSVEKRNETARRLYARAGFVVVEREGDAFTMRLDLPAARS
jgi:ribosomal protein S18 acetylase RimI-like enzyme